MYYQTIVKSSMHICTIQSLLPGRFNLCTVAPQTNLSLIKDSWRSCHVNATACYHVYFTVELHHQTSRAVGWVTWGDGAINVSMTLLALSANDAEKMEACH